MTSRLFIFHTISSTSMLKTHNLTQKNSPFWEIIYIIILHHKTTILLIKTMDNMLMDPNLIHHAQMKRKREGTLPPFSSILKHVRFTFPSTYTCSHHQDIFKITSIRASQRNTISQRKSVFTLNGPLRPQEEGDQKRA